MINLIQKQVAYGEIWQIALVWPSMWLQLEHFWRARRHVNFVKSRQTNFVILKNYSQVHISPLQRMTLAILLLKANSSFYWLKWAVFGLPVLICDKTSLKNLSLNMAREHRETGGRGKKFFWHKLMTCCIPHRKPVFPDRLKTLFFNLGNMSQPFLGKYN